MGAEGDGTKVKNVDSVERVQLLIVNIGASEDK